MKRTPFVRKTPMKRGTGPPRASKPMKRGHTPNGFPESTRMEGLMRSKNICEVGSAVCTQTASHNHHRQSRRFKDQRPVNLLRTCSACHAYIHANPVLSKAMGWIVSQFTDPATVPVIRGENYTHR